MFNRECKTHNQVCNRQLSTESFLHNRVKNIINIKNNSLLEKQVDEHDKTFIHVYDTFISSGNEIEIDHINSSNTAKKSKK